MSLEYSIVYNAENQYEYPVKEARWQFLIFPHEDDNQKLLSYAFTNSMDFPYEVSINAYGFKALRILARSEFDRINFRASFSLLKTAVNPFDFDLAIDPAEEFFRYQELPFKVDHEPFLRKTPLTTLLEEHRDFFQFEKQKTVFENLQLLNQWVFEKIFYTAGVTNVDTTLDAIVENRHGVCQDFAHLFSAIARQYGIPCRYVSGYLHQGNGYFGDSQMHAWTEAYVIDVGWVGFDPTNNILASDNHIKVAHGKDYADCSPIKGILLSQGENTTTHSVQVQGQQQQ
ncbi:transglutaminase-like domain-containing protein [Muriicola soli]|uniref:Transglutaminase family protein n=1 Tax=Muriicola soli TaxID=2507538 RepID=A0A411E9R7_9FLAO|nr:transglutaminase family protein [Muriicola soli]QBA64293.1 transglutaminase family protein [Muriicola soli]